MAAKRAGSDEHRPSGLHIAVEVQRLNGRTQSSMSRWMTPQVYPLARAIRAHKTGKIQENLDFCCIDGNL